MTRTEFATQIKRLAATYGDRYYPMERVESLYKRFRKSSIIALTEAVTQLIGDEIHPPPMKKIVEAVAAATRDLVLEDLHVEQRLRLTKMTSTYAVDCDKCACTGMVDYSRRSEHMRYRYVAICDCEAGRLAELFPENRLAKRWRQLEHKEDVWLELANRAADTEERWYQK